jgi:hypothetical protein
MSTPDRIQTYREFWPFYLREHAKAQTRRWHIVGTGAASILLVAALVTLSYQLFLAALIAGYSPAWAAHFFVEKNRPATLRYPIWSLISDYRMTGAWLMGRLGRELQRAGIANREAPPS